MLFHKIEGAAAVLFSKGVYRQADVYQKGEELFVRWGSGFIGLRHSSFSPTSGFGTTLPHVNVLHIEGVDIAPGRFGAVTVTPEVKARAA